MSVMDDMLAWLTARIEQAEREAPHAHERGCFAWDDYHYRHGRDLDDPQPTAGDACECSGPLRAAARVQAERALFRAHTPGETGGGLACAVCHRDGDEPGPCDSLCWLAYGHRFDATGFEAEWAPSDVEVTT